MAKPAVAVSLVDVDYSNRANAVITTLTAVNNLLEYYYTDATKDITLPDQATSNRYIVGGGTATWNAAVTALNAVITAASLSGSVTALALQSNIDNNDWQAEWNRLVTFSNAIRTALP